MSPLEIRPVSNQKELMAFIKLPFRLYKDDPMWVPPLLSERKKHMDKAKNPFFKHARAEYWLAWRDGKVVGRITAQIDDNFQKFQESTDGHFGFFECENDPEIAQALIDTAEGWLISQKATKMVGPMNFSTNHELGVLVEGFDRPPLILSDWTKPEYPALLEGTGLTKAMDLLMWELHIEDRNQVHQAIWDIAAQVKTKHNIDCRPMRKKDLDAEVGRFMEVYNSAWEKNWGFVPLTEDEVRAYAKDLKPILDPHWAMVAERDGETIGAALSLPDYNIVLKAIGNGRLLPFGWIKALKARKKIDRVRVFALGVKPQYQHTGVAARFYEMHYDSAESTPQTWGEMGWILETNRPMNRAMEGMGGKVVRKYRVYERELEPSAS